MTILSVAALIIPGYDSLPAALRAVFEQSSSGQEFILFAEGISTESEALTAFSLKWYGALYGYTTGATKTKEEALRSKLEVEKEELISRISKTDEYKTVITHIHRLFLEKEIDEFKLVTPEQQELLAKTEFSKKLYTALKTLDTQIEQQIQARANLGLWARINGTDFIHAQSIIELQTQRKEAVTIWHKELRADPAMATIRNTIAVKKLASLQEHATQLSTFFPLLNYRKIPTEKPVIDQLRNQYSLAEGEVTAEPEKVDEQLLTDLLFYCMKQVSDAEINFMDLDGFNKKHANRMAHAVLQAFNEHSSLDLDGCLDEYEHKLNRYITKQLQLINGKPWHVEEPGVTEDLFDSLAYLWNNKTVNKANEFLRKMANAHGFIQATSFSTQNESSFLAILDIYNYARHHEQISEAQTVIASLLSPLLPLYEEYKDIALYEKNAFWKWYRMMMPIIVVVAFVILVAVLFTPLALPELAFTAIFIPDLFVGLALATKYVGVKNDIYRSVREFYYGGAFEIPEFQVNARMSNALGGQEHAALVREFYINELKKCDALEVTFVLKHEEGLLSQKDIDLRKENTLKRHFLCLEWYDIHSNKDLNYKQVPAIVLSRLQQTSDKEYQQLQKSLQKEQGSIRQSVFEVAADLKHTLVKHNQPPVVEPGREIEATTIRANYRHGLFNIPKTLNARAHIEELANFSQQISGAAA